MAGAFGPDLIPEPAGAEPLDHGERDAADHRQGQKLRAADVIERLPDEEDIVRPGIGKQSDAFAGQAQHAVRDNHTLRAPGRSRRVHDREDRVGRGSGLVEAFVSSQDAVEIASRCMGQQGRRGVLGHGFGDLGREFGVGNDQTGPRMRQQVAQPLAALLRIDRNPGDSGPGQAEDHRDGCDRVPHHHGDPVTRHDAALPQMRGEGGRTALDLGVGHRNAVEAGIDALGLAGGMRGQEAHEAVAVGDRHGRRSVRRRSGSVPRSAASPSPPRRRPRRRRRASG